MAGRFLACVFAALALGSLTAGAQPPTSLYGEAPGLRERVGAGQLPPIDARLPGNPLVVQPWPPTSAAPSRVGAASALPLLGRYGGTWRNGMVGQGDGALVFRLIGYENLVRWHPDWNRADPSVLANVAQSITVHDDATRYIFRLRRGLKWSDGVPFTADDVVFWYEDVLLSPELTGEPPDWLRPGGRTVTVHKLDDYAVEFRFATPNSIFLDHLATPYGIGPTTHPRHWLRQFHARHNPDGIARLMQQAEAGSWPELFHLKAGTVIGPSDPARLFRIKARGAIETLPDDFTPWPTLGAWHLTRLERDNAGRAQAIAERNPYYWKIDLGFRQLPYIDRVAFTLFPTAAALIDSATRGEIDFQSRTVGNPEHVAVIESHIATGGYKIVEQQSSDANVMAFNFNLLHRDPAKRRFFADRQFRVALSHALDRDRIIRDILVQPGDGPEQRPEKSQVAPKRESVFYHPRLATQYLDYDPQRANRLLDAAGYDRRRSDGLRLTADGVPLDFELLVRADRQHHIETAAVAVENWRAVGVGVRVKVMDRQAIKDLSLQNLHDAIVSYPGGGGLDVLVEPGVYLPTFQGDAFYAVPWALWRIDPRHPLAEEPPADVRAMFGDYDQILRTTDRTERRRLLERLLDRNADQFFLIGVATATSQKGILRHAMRNVPEIMPQSWAYPTPAPTNPSLYFLAE